MDFFKNLAVAFSMYSALPMPQFKWNEKNMRFALAFFPVIGLVAGVCEFIWWEICSLLHFNNLLFAAGFTVIPVIITGGIHFDGFCDTADALSSHAPLERKLEILKDSNSGAFAIIFLASYFILYLGFASQVRFDLTVIIVLTLGFILSRALSGLAIATFRCAKNSGLVYTFASHANKKAVRNILIVIAAMLFVCAFILNVYYGLAILAACLGVFSYYRVMSYHKFNGITGDLAGYFLVLCELAVLAAVAVVQSAVMR